MNHRVSRVLFPIVAALALVFAGSLIERPQTIDAHPLGNFTINRLALLRVTADGVSLRYVIDMAEIPTFQEIRANDHDGDGVLNEPESSVYAARRATELAKGLDLRLAGRRLELTPEARTLSFLEGQGGLSTLRLSVDYRAALPDGWQAGADASFTDSNYNDRIGWKEIVVQPGAGVALTQSSVVATDETAELTAYPADQLKTPASVHEARFRFEAGDPSTPTSMVTAPAASRGKTNQTRGLGHFASLVSEKRLTPAFVALSLLAAAAWGAAHAVGPGHGKTIVAAYLVGSRGTPRHAVLLGLTVTATHTSSVITLGLVTLYASRFIATEDLYLWLSVASGLFVVAMGAGLFLSRLLRLQRRTPRSLHAHGSHSHAGEHVHDDDHGHDHGHSHAPPAPGLGGLIALGVSGGLLPCPTALVVMLAAIALDRTIYGLVLVLAFSVGLAAVLTGIGVVLVYSKKALGGSQRFGRVATLASRARLAQTLPLASALLIFVVGLVLTGRAVSIL